MIRIRRAGVEDAAAIAWVHVQAWHETYPGIIPKDVLDGLSVEDRARAWSGHLTEGPPYHRFTFVAQDGDAMVGFASGGPLRTAFAAGDGVDEALSRRFDGELQAIYLLRSHQRAGTGRALFDAVKSELALRGLGSMLVWVLEANPTRGFYGRMGGAEVGRKRIKIGDWLEEIAYGWEPAQPA